MFRVFHWRKLFHRFDWTLVFATLVVIVLGFVNLWGSARESQYQLFARQLSWIGLGGLIFFVVASIDYRILSRYAYFAYGIGTFLLVVVLVTGKMVGGSRRWFDLGPSHFQPSEIVKVLIILALAKYLNDTPALEGRSLKHLLVPLGLAGFPVFLVAAQPDLGTAMVIMLVFATVMVAASMKLKTLAGLLTVGVLAAAPIWEYGLHTYQKNRVLAFINPALDPATAWQPRLAMNAVGSGRFLGKGLLEGNQIRQRSLPAQWTDFPFAALAEEWGFLGCSIVLLAYSVLILWCLKIASEARDRFGAATCIGVAALLFWQVTINIGMVTGVLPVVGVTLPLISYGGSSVLTIMTGLGLVMGVSLRRYSY
ncbi:MAG: rod shape-determining protein RodA [Deltaproteobacteria bacterium]|nr:rod shape-determining protein RodA [Deltaproteobacteria bacterium]